jgi:hypothetical protein
MANEIAALSERVSKLEAWAHEPFDFTHLVERLERLERAQSLRQFPRPEGGKVIELYRKVRSNDHDWHTVDYVRDTAAEAVIEAARRLIKEDPENPGLFIELGNAVHDFDSSRGVNND